MDGGHDKNGYRTVRITRQYLSCSLDIDIQKHIMPGGGLDFQEVGAGTVIIVMHIRPFGPSVRAQSFLEFIRRNEKVITSVDLPGAGFSGRMGY